MIQWPTFERCKAQASVASSLRRPRVSADPILLLGFCLDPWRFVARDASSAMDYLQTVVSQEQEPEDGYGF